MTNMKNKLYKKLKELKKQRDIACKDGDVYTQQVINHEILGIAIKLKVDYYSIA